MNLIIKKKKKKPYKAIRRFKQKSLFRPNSFFFSHKIRESRVRVETLYLVVPCPIPRSVADGVNAGTTGEMPYPGIIGYKCSPR